MYSGNILHNDKFPKQQHAPYKTFSHINFVCDPSVARSTDCVLLCRISDSRNNKGHIPEDDFPQTPLKSGRFESAEEGRKAVVGGVGLVDAIRSSR